MSIQKLALNYMPEKKYNFNTNTEFLLHTQGQGMKCGLCQSKIFFDYKGWKAHCRGKRHNSRLNNYKSTSFVIDEEKDKLQKELKIQKAIVCQKSNECEVYKNKLRQLKGDFIKLKIELKEKFNLS